MSDHSTGSDLSGAPKVREKNRSRENLAKSWQTWTATLWASKLHPFPHFFLGWRDSAVTHLLLELQADHGWSISNETFRTFGRACHFMRRPG
jgi:hypothetical protein